LDRFDDCLAKGRLKKTQPDLSLVAAEIRLALKELERARSRYANGNWGDVTTQSYFALYHAARAGLLSRGYVDTNFYGLCAGVERLYVGPGHLPASVLNDLREAKSRKDLVYHGSNSSATESRQAMEWAQDFARRMLSALSLDGFDPSEIDRPSPAGG